MKYLFGHPCWGLGWVEGRGLGLRDSWSVLGNAMSVIVSESCDSWTLFGGRSRRGYLGDDCEIPGQIMIDVRD